MESHVSQLWRTLLALTGAADGASVPTHWWGLVPVVVCLVCLAQLAHTVLRREVLSSRPEDQAALLVFWATGVALLVAAYVVSSGPNPDIPGPQNARYLVPVSMAVAVAAPVLWRLTGGWRSVAASIAVAILTLPGSISVIGLQVAHQRERSPIAVQTGDVEAFVRQSGASTGFAGYWDALPFRYKTGIPTLAVDLCSKPQPNFCPHEVNTRLGWYAKPTPRRVFVLINSRPPTGFSEADLGRVQSLGAPVARKAVGTMTVLIFERAGHQVAPKDRTDRQFGSVRQVPRGEATASRATR